MPTYNSPVVVSAVRVTAGLALIVHGLAHAVFASRGSAAALPTFGGAYVLLGCYSLAIVAFTVAGVGLLGSRVFGAFRQPALLIGVFLSSIALALGWDGDLWPGLAGNVAVAWYLLRRHGAAWPPEPAAPRPSRHGWRMARVAGESAAVLFVAYIAAGAILWPWHRSWGTTDADWAMALPGDPPAREPAIELMHAIAIDAPDYVVWAWLAQIGQDRAGFYSYDSLERLFGVAIVNAETIHPEWQQRAVGNLLPATQRGYLGGLFDEPLGWHVTAFEPCRAIVLENWGAFVIVPDGPERSRLVIRSRMGNPHAPVWGAALSFVLFEIPHFIMERGMLRGIKTRAESARGRDGAVPCAPAAGL